MDYIIVSACLLGENCKYSGGSNRNETILKWRERLLREERAVFVPVCPEVMGGLPTPRTPAEICGSQVLTKDGRDVTEEYVRGAGEALRIFEKYGCCLAILKERSPSCGSGEIYDGNFSGSVTAADGIAAGLLKKRGARVYGESQAEEILELLFEKTEEGRKSRV